MIYFTNHTGKNIEIEYPYLYINDFATRTLANIAADIFYINMNKIWNNERKSI